MLRSICDDVWVLDAPLRVMGIEMGTRMTIIRLSGGRLFVHSPVAIDDETAKVIRDLGEVEWIIAPNLMHHLFIQPFREYFPEAKLFAVRGLSKKRKDLKIDGILGDEVHEWADEIDQIRIEGIPGLREVDFFHLASQTLVLTDILFNIPEPKGGLWTSMMMRANGALGGPRQTRILRAFIKDREEFRRSMEQLLMWNFERITMAHGEVLLSKARVGFKEATAWLYPQESGASEAATS